MIQVLSILIQMLQVPVSVMTPLWLNLCQFTSMETGVYHLSLEPGKTLYQTLHISLLTRSTLPIYWNQNIFNACHVSIQHSTKLVLLYTKCGASLTVMDLGLSFNLPLKLCSAQLSVLI